MAAKNIKGLTCELKAQLRFAKQSNLLVFIPLGGLGPIDLVTLDKTTGTFQAYDVKALNRRKKGIKFTNRFGEKVRRSSGGKITRPLTSLQKKLGVKIIYED
jgi:monoamine oxidase